ncbi:MAG: OsmC family protein, partial [Pseudomonadota bacterium]
RYLATAGDDAGDGAAAAAGEVLATTSRDGFRTDVVSGVHRLVADEPVDVPGGTDLGPSPYDLLSAALASCTSMTLRMYANHKGIDADTFTVGVRHDRIHAKDCEECETKDGHIDRFVRRINVRGDFDDDVRRRLLEIADRCPVHRTLHSEVLVETDWRDNTT